MTSRNHLRNRGFTVTEVLLTVAIASLVFVVVGTTIYNFSKSQVHMQQDQDFSQYKAQLERVMRADTAYLATMQNNPNMACVLNKTNCAGAGGEINLYDEKGNVVPFLSLTVNATAGLTASGGLCNGFNNSNATSACPFKWIATWKAICSANPCLNPVAQISATLYYAANHPVGDVNTVNYFVSHQFKQTSSSDAAVCASMGGQLQGNPQRCVKPVGSYSSQCPSGQYVSGFDNQGNVLCRSYPDSVCGVGEIVQGIDKNGKPICSAGCMQQVLAQGLCLPRVTNPTYGAQVQSLLNRGLVSASRVRGMGCK